MEPIPGLDIYWQSSEDMSAIADESIQSIITSPPYWKLKDYGHEGQIGTADESYDEYHDRLRAVWQECYEKLQSDGTMWIVVDTVMERGDMRLLPLHVAEHAQVVGFRLEDLVVWHKPTAIAGMTDRNVVNKKEYVVYLSKGVDHEFRADANGENGTEDPAVSEDGGLGNLWRYPVKRGTAGQNVLHKAPYPTALIRRIVDVSTEVGDTVLDPFLGSGSTAYAALESNRKCIGFEINSEFADVIYQRLSALRQRTLSEY
jgi:site-specific DNA-methyltransferase (adenine-specific)